MFDRLRKIGLSNWILIGMILGIVVGLFFNLYVGDSYAKNFIMDNIFQLCGNAFISLLKMLVVPLVFCSIVVSLSSISDMQKLKAIGGKTILLYLLTSIISILVAFGIGFIIQPGAGLHMPVTNNSSSMMSNQTITDLLLNMIPENPFTALINNEILPAVILGVIFSFGLIKLKGKTPIVDKLFKDFDHIIMKTTDFIMNFAPVGIFCLMVSTFGTFGFESLIPLAKLFISILLAVFIMAFVVYPAMLIIFARLNPLIFFRKFLQTILFAFSSNSSTASIPLSLENLEEMGVSIDVASFTTPLGISINKNGGSVFYVLSVVFAAQVHGIDLGVSTILTLIFIILIAGNTAPGIPFGYILSLNIVFESIALPLQTIDLIVGIYNIVDMFLSAVGVVGNAICTVIVAFRQDSLDIDVFNGKKEAENWEDM